ncbi:uncharacterized protein LOC144707400 [Wolffia australiana]
MRVLLEAQCLWDAIEKETVSRTKDSQALSTLLGAIPEEVNWQIDDTESAKEIWGKLSGIVTEMGSLGEFIEEKVVVPNFLRATPAKFDATTTSIGQFSDIDNMSLDEAVGSLKLHEDKIKDRQDKRDELALFSRSFKAKKGQDDSSSCRRGQRKGEKAKGQEESDEDNEKEEMKPFDISKLKCYNCQKFGHFADKCRLPKKKRPREREETNMVEEAGESALLLMQADDCVELFLKGVNGATKEDLWYIDIGASSHMSGKRS